MDAHARSPKEPAVGKMLLQVITSMCMFATEQLFSQSESKVPYHSAARVLLRGGVCRCARRRAEVSDTEDGRQKSATPVRAMYDGGRRTARLMRATDDGERRMAMPMCATKDGGERTDAPHEV